MGINLSKRSIVRIISFMIAIISVLTALTIINGIDAKQAKLKLEYSYVRAIGDLSISADNISTTLSKEIYAGTPEMLSTLSSKLWRDASTAKAQIAVLPITDMNLENTNKFLSQVGNYAISIAQKSAKGETLSLEEYSNLASLYEFSKQLCDDMWELENMSQLGELSYSKVRKVMQNKDTKAPPSISEGFTSFEEGFDSYPTLIYDGPFSDHILEREPLLLIGKTEVDLQTALEKASKVSNIPADKLNNINDEGGKMASFCFETDGTNIAVTKVGGLVSYMLKGRNVEVSNITANEATATANAYLLSLGIIDMTTSYYEIYDNICTINFAGLVDSITVYTDLIKVSVALDNGEIVGFDARGYIVNHQERSFTERKVTLSEAQGKLSPLLNVESSKLALIPSEGLNEVLTYEFTCSSRQGMKVLVYIDVTTGEEEQILILLESDSGILTI